jgi:MFS family permease
MGILFLNSYGRYLPRRRTIEAGLLAMGILLCLLAVAGPISHFLESRASSTGLAEASRLVSLLSLVMAIAFLIGAAYVIVAVSAQTQLQEELPEDVRGRVFGILNMLVSIASLAPIIIVTPVADLIGHREPVILGVGAIVVLFTLSSIFTGREAPALTGTARAPQTPMGAPVDPVTIAMVPTDFTAAPPPNLVTTEGEPAPEPSTARGRGPRVRSRGGDSSK